MLQNEKKEEKNEKNKGWNLKDFEVNLAQKQLSWLVSA